MHLLLFYLELFNGLPQLLMLILHMVLPASYLLNLSLKLLLRMPLSQIQLFICSLDELLVSLQLLFQPGQMLIGCLEPFLLAPYLLLPHLHLSDHRFEPLPLTVHHLFLFLHRVVREFDLVLLFAK